MNEKLPRLLSNSFLLVTSVWSLRRTPKGFRYATAASRLYFVTSALTLINLLLYTNSLIKYFEEASLVWSYTLGLPLITVQLSREIPNLPELPVSLYFLVPVYSVLVYHSQPDKVDSLLLLGSQSVTCLFLAAYSITRGGLAGFGLGFIHLFSLFRAQIGADPQPPWALLMSFSNLFLVDLLKDSV